MPWLGGVLVFLLITLAAHAAEPEDHVSIRTFDLISVSFVNFEIARPMHPHPFQMMMRIMPTPGVDTHPFGRYGDSTSRLAIAIEAKLEIEWKSSSNVTQIGDRTRASLLSVLRFESRGERIEVKPRRHSLSIEWRMYIH